jgi:hypothetical protein
MDLTVLVEAKKEYLNQLCMLMCPAIIEAFADMYEEAEKLSKGRNVLLQYQTLLRMVQEWSDSIIKGHADNHTNACSWFNDLLAAVFVSFVKILSSVRLKTENKKISIKLPTTEYFVHKCYINVAKDIYKDPYIYHNEMSKYERDDQLSIRITGAIEATIKELIPVQQILKTYMSQDTSNIDVGGDPEEAEVEDEEEEEESPAPEVAEETNEEPAPAEPAPGGEAGAAAPQETEELKSISVPAPPPDVSENLFDDAIDEEKKP